MVSQHLFSQARSVGQIKNDEVVLKAYNDRLRDELTESRSRYNVLAASLPSIWRLTILDEDWELVRDSPVVPGQPVYSKSGEEFYIHAVYERNMRLSVGPNTWLNQNEAYATPEDAAFARKREARNEV